MTYRCPMCAGKGEREESHNGVVFYPEPCFLCDGAGEFLKPFVRLAEHDKRIAHGDDFAGDAWFDLEAGELIYSAVGHDRNRGLPPNT